MVLLDGVSTRNPAVSIHDIVGDRVSGMIAFDWVTEILLGTHQNAASENDPYGKFVKKTESSVVGCYLFEFEEALDISEKAEHLEMMDHGWQLIDVYS